MASEAVILQAAALVAAGGVKRVVDAEVFDVDGRSATYELVVRPGGRWSCKCPASTECSHIHAVALMRTQDEALQAIADLKRARDIAALLVASIQDVRVERSPRAELANELATLIHAADPNRITDEARAAGEAAFDAL